MTGYLVLYCATLDDVPVAFCATAAEAVAIAREIFPRDEDYEHHHLVAQAIRALGRDTSTFACVTIVQFIDGKPVKSASVEEAEEPATPGS